MIIEIITLTAMVLAVIWIIIMARKECKEGFRKKKKRN